MTGWQRSGAFAIGGATARGCVFKGGKLVARTTVSLEDAT